MAYGHMRPDPVELFKNTVGYYKKLIDATQAEGFTRQEAIELLKIYALCGIEDDLGSMGGSF